MPTKRTPCAICGHPPHGEPCLRCDPEAAEHEYCETLVPAPLTRRNGQDEQDVVLLIEYDLDMHPFSANRGEDKYDVVWCKRDAQLYYQSCGGDLYLESPPRRLTSHDQSKRYHYSRAPTRIWLADSVESICTVKSDKLYDREGLRKLGYVVLPKPATDPFEEGTEEATQYCFFCEDHLPETDLCEHLDYCPKCGSYAYVKRDPGIECPEHADHPRCHHPKRQRVAGQSPDRPGLAGDDDAA